MHLNQVKAAITGGASGLGLPWPSVSSVKAPR